jgi:PAS domain S-box-containing protein
MIRFARFSPSKVALSYIALSVLVLFFFAVPLWYAWTVNIGTFRAYVQGEDVQRLVDIFHRDGASGLSAAIQSRAASASQDEVVAFADASKTLLAGNLSAWPVEVPDAPGTYGLVLDRDGSSTRIVASHLKLPGGAHLLIGRESARFQSLTEFFWYGILGATAIVLLLGAAVGWWSRRALLANVQQISRDAAGIVEGDLSRRLSAPGASTELDVLADTVNGMLERLARQNAQLEGEIAVRRDAEHALHRAHDNLEHLVAQRTAELAQANESLRRSEAFLVDGQKISRTGSWGWDLASGKVIWSDEQYRLLGFEPRSVEPSVRAFLEAVHSEDRPRIKLMLENAMREKKSYAVEYRIVRADGALRYMRSVARVVAAESGTADEYIGVTTDITERKRAETLIAGENRVLEMIARGSSLPVTLEALCRVMEEIFSGSLASIVLIDGDGRLRKGAAPSLPASYMEPFEGARIGADAGPCGVAAFGGEAIVVPDIKTYPHAPEYRDIAAAHGLTACWSTPVFSSDRKVLATFALLHRTARTPSAQETSTINQLSHLASIVIERTQALHALRRSEERFALAMGAAGEGHWDWNIETDEFYASRRMLEMYGFSPDATFESRADFLAQVPFHPEDKPRWEEAAAAYFAGTNERFDLEIRIVPHGVTRWIHLTGMCCRDDTGRPARWAGSITDVTDRKEAQEALRESERQRRQTQRLEAMGTLAGGIAHDFNNILGAILGYGEMALRGTRKGSRLRRDLDSIVAAGERGRALVDRILAFSRSGVGERVAVHVEAVVREALDLLSARLPAGIMIDARLNAGAAAMLGDATQVHQVVMNLASNAVQAMPSGGVLQISLETCRVAVARTVTIGSLTPGDYVVLDVADSGPGIPVDVLDRIFDPFFTTKEVGVGTGLGLSLVHGIVTDVGGSIDVASTPGKGSVFTVYVPRHGEAANPPLLELTIVPRGNRQHVMIVDDEVPLVDLATRTLDQLGYSPVGFTSSTAALEALRADPKRFDALITDERMPGLSGSALIDEARAIRRSLPILLVTGYSGGLVATRAYNSGATEVLTKPLSARELATCLARVLQTQQSDTNA